MLNYSQVWSSFPACAPRDGRCHVYSWKSISGTLGDLVTATGIAADVTRSSVDGGFQQHCVLSILSLSLPLQWHTAALCYSSWKPRGPPLAICQLHDGPSDEPESGSWTALPYHLVVSLGSESLFDDYDDDERLSPACQLILRLECLTMKA